MHASMGSPEGWLFLVGVAELFAWGVILGVKGLLAPHGGGADHGRPPRSPAAYDWRLTEAKRDLYRIA